MSGHYIGSELELFSIATNWKGYVARQFSRFVGGRVLDVGAGIGSNIPYLHTPSVTEWTALEPDPVLAAVIAGRIDNGELPASCRVLNGTVDTLAAAECFDTILYLDVIEHIEDDAAELRRAASHLAPHGRLVVLAPAHQFLFSPFDAVIGHHRRYTAQSLRGAGPPGCRVELCRMLDSVGFFASLANRIMLRSEQPSPAQIRFWDRILVPLSRLTDRTSGFTFGKSVAIVWAHEA
ncbi:MAG TPA: methyltransferase domain-containing protein [Acetobacteraceae bacterium]|nr:methyltransferase domain-containing protein [Acetobacteraceae bacterium]